MHYLQYKINNNYLILAKDALNASSVFDCIASSDNAFHSLTVRGIKEYLNAFVFIAILKKGNHDAFSPLIFDKFVI